MSSSKKAKVALALALLLLCLSGIAAGLTIVRLYSTETQVRHTYDVEVAAGDVEASLAEVGRSRVAYIGSGDPKSRESFEAAINKVSLAIARIRYLTRDNPSQQALCDQLEATANLRVASSRKSVELVEQNVSTPEKQLQFTYEVAKGAFDTASLTHQMRQNEDKLLAQRGEVSRLLFTVISSILAVSFILSACMFWIHYSLLNRELNERRAAENQLRQLSLELMRVQDEEHRRFGRELHDGLGQTLAGAKMMVDALSMDSPDGQHIGELASLLGEAVSQTRTISYLFHPPFLDEIGFSSAAKWLIEGYGRRTGMAVSINIPETQERLQPGLELTLYRVLQEALNNVHRHSRSTKVEVSFQADPKTVTLCVRDDGKGIPSDRLAALRANALHSGVGLTGMKERVREQGGELKIRSDGTGTEIVVAIPIGVHIESTSSKSSESLMNIG